MNSAPGHPPDSEIIQRVVDGDVDAFELLLKRYRSYVFGIVSKIVPREAAEEVAHETFVKAYQSLPSFSGRSSFSHWLHSIASRCGYDFLRKAYRNQEIPLSSLTEDHQEWLDAVLADRSAEGFREAASRREAGEVLDHALAGLGPEDRMVLTLVHLEGLPVKEAARLLGWNVVSVKVRAHRARHRLRKIISKLLEVRMEDNETP